MRNIDARAAGLGMAIAGIILWIIGVAVEAPAVSIVLAIGIVMLGALLLVRGERS